MKTATLLVTLSLLLGSTALHGQEPRVKIEQQHVRPAIFSETNSPTNSVHTGFDARWSQFGGYLQRIVDRVQIEWDKAIEQAKDKPPTGTMVSIKFRLHMTGAVSDAKVTSGDPDSLAAKLTLSTITNHAPYETWTDEMVKVLGDSQELTWNFYVGPP